MSNQLELEYLKELFHYISRSVSLDLGSIQRYAIVLPLVKNIK